MDALEESIDDVSLPRCSIMVHWVALKDAKEAGIVESDFTVEPGTICSRMVSNYSKLYGKKFGKAFVNQLQYVIEDSKYVLKNTGKAWFASNYLDYFDTDGIYGDGTVYLIYSNEEKTEFPNESFGFESYN